MSFKKSRKHNKSNEGKKKMTRENTSDITLLKEAIDLFWSSNKEKSLHYQRMLQEKYGMVYDPTEKMKQQENWIKHPNLHDIKEKTDFSSIDTYVRYAERVYEVKNEKYKHLRNNRKCDMLTTSKTNEILSRIDVQVKHENIKPDFLVNLGDEHVIFARHEHEDSIPSDTLVHEIGHIVENRLRLHVKELKSRKLTNASSSYIKNASEVFCDNFYNYFLHPEYLKAGWKDIYDELDEMIPRDIKMTIIELIKITSTR